MSSAGMSVGEPAGVVDPDTIAFPVTEAEWPGPGTASPKTLAFELRETSPFEPMLPSSLAWRLLPSPLTSWSS